MFAWHNWCMICIRWNLGCRVEGPCWVEQTMPHHAPACYSARHLFTGHWETCMYISCNYKFWSYTSRQRNKAGRLRNRRSNKPYRIWFFCKQLVRKMRFLLQAPTYADMSPEAAAGFILAFASKFQNNPSRLHATRFDPFKKQLAASCQAYIPSFHLSVWILGKCVVTNVPCRFSLAQLLDLSWCSWHHI